MVVVVRGSIIKDVPEVALMKGVDSGGASFGARSQVLEDDE